MHEWLITRGDVRGAPFEIQMQIQVPVNVVIPHEGMCHQKLQFGNGGLEICFSHILMFHNPEEILNWLDYLHPYLSIAAEKKRWVHGMLDIVGGTDYSHRYTEG